MSINDLMPWSWGRKHLPITHREDEHPVALLHRDLNKVFEEFYRSFESAPYGEVQLGFSEVAPRIDMAETEKEIKVTAELPGMNEDDVEITLSRDMVTIRGEKKEQKEEALKGHYRMERRYGMFSRSLPLPCEIDEDRAAATFKNGVLHLTLPKTSDTQRSAKTIPIKKA